MAAALIASKQEPPKRGSGIHPLYEVNLGGSSLDDEYKPTKSYSYATQRRNINASVSHHILDGAAQAFADLTLDNYPGETVANLSKQGLGLIRIIRADMLFRSTLDRVFSKKLLVPRAKSLVERFTIR